jgi:hypothetical protein
MTVSSAVHPQSVEMPKRVRSLTTNRPLAGRWHGHTSQGRRARDLFRAIMKSAGNPTDDLVKSRILGIVELMIATEDLRLKAARGEIVDAESLAALNRLTNTARRELRSLVGTSTRRVPGIGELLQRRQLRKRS